MNVNKPTVRRAAVRTGRIFAFSIGALAIVDGVLYALYSVQPSFSTSLSFSLIVSFFAGLDKFLRDNNSQGQGEEQCQTVKSS